MEVQFIRPMVRYFETTLDLAHMPMARPTGRRHLTLTRWAKIHLLIIAMLAIVLVPLGVGTGYLLVVNNPQPADVIVSLNGEYVLRPAFAIDLIRGGYANRVILNVERGIYMFDVPQIRMANEYLASLPADVAPKVSLCIMGAENTRQEAHETEKCMQRVGARSAVLVTSNYHTRRALATFRHELPQYQFTVASAEDDYSFQPQWWRSRVWARTFLLESTKMAWFELVERWRG